MIVASFGRYLPISGQDPGKPVGLEAGHAVGEVEAGVVETLGITGTPQPVPAVTDVKWVLMEKAILLAVAASLCTATASVCQRLGARNSETAGFDVWLVFRLARQPVWLLGVASMILGFVFQLTALHFGPLALVQPVLALELLFVFGYLAVAGSKRITVKRRDWLAAAAMSAGIGLFLWLASPSGGRLHAPGSLWLLSGLVTFGVVLAALAVAFGFGR